MKISVKQFQSNLSAYLCDVENGTEIIITSRRKPIAKIVPIGLQESQQMSRKQLISDLNTLHQALGKTKLKKSMRDTVLQQRRSLDSNYRAKFTVNSITYIADFLHDGGFGGVNRDHPPK